ncbi:4-hydroxythreonine-4-phosphate dehydrogenase [invertebrate metagenome]|uniref:4-hydroxythreonine-4-phosphate dehydrogenase n=1 Tax=invertebrate metagenome TaxID=1711999 RepID=A0A484HBD2_9ZZZZ
MAQGNRILREESTIITRILKTTYEVTSDITKFRIPERRIERIMDFIFMLTRNDQTVEDCLAVLNLIAPLGVAHIGFKDVGVGYETLQTLARRIRCLGATSYLEIVNTSPESTCHSLVTASRIGVDRVMGGQNVAFALRQLASADYFPFPGRPVGHPTRLEGSPEEIAADCRRMRQAGCAGVDLLAYRATDTDPLALVHAARQALDGGVLVVAGSINSPTRIHALAAAGADAFTVGSAAFDGSFSPRKGLLLAQLNEIMAVCTGLQQPGGLVSPR